MTELPSTLPKGFEDLEIWVDDWLLPDVQARNDKRLAGPMEGIQAFYDAMLREAPRALEYLHQRKLGELDASEEHLLKLMLAFAEVIPAVEFYQQPEVIDGFSSEKFRIDETLDDLAPQV
jgi:hypothetical protein